MDTVVDERGRVLIPQGLRTEVGLEEGTVVTIKKEGRQALLLVALSRGRRTWKELNGLEPTRTGKPKWPTPEEIKGIWE